MPDDDPDYDEEAATREFEALTPTQRATFLIDYLKRNPDSASGWMMLAFDAEDLGDAADAKRYLEQSIHLYADDKESAVAYYNLAVLLENKFDDKVNARLNYLSALHVDPEYLKPYNNMGRLLREDFKEPALAERYLVEGLKRTPDDAHLMHNLALGYAENYSDYPRALPFMQRAHELDPNDVDILYNLDFLHRQIDRRQSLDPYGK